MQRCPLDACAAVAAVLHPTEMGPGFFEPFVIREFPKEEAREFLRQLGGSDRWANDAFLAAYVEKIYEVGLEGGRAGPARMLGASMLAACMRAHGRFMNCKVI